MATVIRLARGGRKNMAVYRISVADETRPTTGKFLQQIGHYDPNQKPPEVKIDESSAIAWLEKGAQPSDTVKTLFKSQGILSKWEQVKKGVPLEQAEAAPVEWKTKKAKPSKKVQEKAKAEAEAKAAEEEAKKAAEAEAKAAESAESSEEPAAEADKAAE